MKIGIITLPLHTNYGGILQAYALQTVLINMGHKVTIIDKSPYVKKLPLYKIPYSYSKRFFQKIVLKKKVKIFTEKHHNDTYKVVSKYIQPFIDKYINRIEVDNPSELLYNSYDALVVGSDQIWRPSYYTPIENAYFNFAKKWDVKRIAYAPSFGKEIWEYSPKQTERCKVLLNDFDAIAVREDSGVELCKIHFKKQVEHVLDPTMLLEVDYYRKQFINERVEKSKGTLLNYILDNTEEKTAFINKLANERNITTFRINAVSEDLFASIEERIKPSVEKWLGGFEDAEFVITDSFHACVFSIIFNKQFVVIANKDRGYARFKSILSLFDLEDRLVYDVNEWNSESRKEIDWKKVNLRLDELRNESLLFLHKALA